MEKKLLVTGSLLVLIGVILGAMAAHALENYLSVDQLNSFETGVRYQIYHGLALLVFSQVSLLPLKSKNVVWILFLGGTVLFSFSIYGLTISTLIDINTRFLGPITPLGGFLLISGWVYALFKISLYKQ